MNVLYYCGAVLCRLCCVLFLRVSRRVHSTAIVVSCTRLYCYDIIILPNAILVCTCSASAVLLLYEQVLLYCFSPIKAYCTYLPCGFYACRVRTLALLACCCCRRRPRLPTVLGTPGTLRVKPKTRFQLVLALFLFPVATPSRKNRDTGLGHLERPAREK